MNNCFSYAQVFMILEQFTEQLDTTVSSECISTVSYNKYLLISILFMFAVAYNFRVCVCFFTRSIIVHVDVA